MSSRNSKVHAATTVRFSARTVPTATGRMMQSGHGSGTIPKSVDSPPRRYSDVVASRSPSPVERESNMLPRVDLASGSIPTYKPLLSDNSAASQGKPETSETHLGTPADGAEWTLVQPRQARSLESAGRRSRRRERLAADENCERKRAVEKQPAKDRVKIRASRMPKRSNTDLDPQGMGPSIPKEGASHHELEGIDMSEDEDLEGQRRALNEGMGGRNQKKVPTKQPRQRRRNRATDKSNGVHRRVVDVAQGRSSGTKQVVVRPRLPRPVEQIPPNSYLGKALGLGTASLSESSSSPESTSSSLSSDSSDLSSSSDGDDSSTDDPDKLSQHGHRHQKSRRPRRHWSALKPIPPEVYDGAANAQAYHQFVAEASAYLRDGKVKGSRRKIFKLSYFLTGKAHRFYFYTQFVSTPRKRWKLGEFFKELFNYCFSYHERLQMRYQNDNAVAEFVYGLIGLHNAIGITDEREKVAMLWTGLRTSIQEGLWRNGYDPEVSDWAEIVAAARVIEISENTMGPNRHGRPRATCGRVKRTSTATTTRDMISGEPQSRSHSIHNQVLRNDLSNRRGRDLDNPCTGSASPAKSSPARHKGKTKTSEGRGPWGSSSGIEMRKKERAELLTAGRCFRCKEKGHISRNCPSRSMSQSKSKKSLEMNSFNMYTDLDETESERGLADIAITIGCMSFVEGEQPAKEVDISGAASPLIDKFEQAVLKNRPIGVKVGLGKNTRSTYLQNINEASGPQIAKPIPERYRTRGGLLSTTQQHRSSPLTSDPTFSPIRISLPFPLSIHRPSISMLTLYAPEPTASDRVAAAVNPISTDLKKAAVQGNRDTSIESSNPHNVHHTTQAHPRVSNTRDRPSPHAHPSASLPPDDLAPTVHQQTTTGISSYKAGRRRLLAIPAAEGQANPGRHYRNVASPDSLGAADTYVYEILEMNLFLSN
ncbi:hypothetical protein BD779DRAFT_1670150 [Infundibulicybe gibba]|nr:hypothetical protein BD779DRAFT_1670150 [Infundibulicybe gibba]